MIKLQNYVNSSGEIKLYKYKVLNLKFKEYLKFNIKTNDLIILEPLEEINGYVSQSSINLNEKPEDERILLSYVDGFTFSSNEKVFEPLVEHDNDFYLFAFKNREEIDLDTDDFYYIDSNSSVEYDFSDDSIDGENYLFQVNFSNVKQLKNYDFNKIEYKFVENINKEYTNLVYLTVPSTICISDLVFKGRKIISDSQTENNVIANFKLKSDDVNLFPHLLHPINVQKEYAAWFDQTNLWFSLFKTYFFDKKYLDWAAFYGALLKKMFSNEANISMMLNFNENIILDKLIKVTEKLTSNFAGMSSKEKSDFKEETYNGNDPKQYCDFEIYNFLQNFQDEALKDYIRLILLMMSKYIASSYCFKGGLTEEHELFLPFYLEKTLIKNTWRIKSNYFYFDNEKNEWLPKNNILDQHNIFKFHNKLINMPILPEKISEINISNSPLDFNTDKSHNFNYLIWNPSKSLSLNKYFLKLGISPSQKQVKLIEISWLTGAKPPHPRQRFKKLPWQKILLKDYFKDIQQSWESFWEEIKKRLDVMAIINNPENEVDIKYTQDHAYMERIGYESKYNYSTPNSHSSPGWSLKFTDEKMVIPFRVINNLNEEQIINAEYLYKSQNDFKKTLNEEFEDKLTFCFQLLEKNFILEDITIKSIFANNIEIKIDNYITKNYKLSFEDSKLLTETKLII
ncbi:hypothetical protein JPM7_2050 [Metamycoplasma equirhinis]|uniref:hypothetical protein n=1 Tax=Metamycoplasma equirhinis TaxID=92402 RepID=UPI0025728492|nr:hypothetical protein [Metamycoplasma equirhinis]BDX52598.1 hypothetical protein JPM7_2050 [Metamycoplasma equirhinis]